jgi:uncharacterized membrane protein YdjX (TVP38/TMEM64 family)
MTNKRSVILWSVLAAIVLLTVVVNLSFLPFPHYFKWFLLEIKHLGPWGPVVFVILYAIVCLCFLPGSALTLAAGFMFGMFWGAAASSLGATLGATAAFLIARTVGRRWFERRLATHPVFLRIDHAIGGQGFKIVLLTRLCSLLPFDLTSYAFGLIDVPLGRYIAATWLGRLPEVLVWAYIGSTAKSLHELAAGNVQFGIERKILLAVGVAAMIAVTVVLSHLAKKALHEATGDSPTARND